jgi:hypothetical protein
MTGRSRAPRGRTQAPTSATRWWLATRRGDGPARHHLQVERYGRHRGRGWPPRLHQDVEAPRLLPEEEHGVVGDIVVYRAAQRLFTLEQSSGYPVWVV